MSTESIQLLGLDTPKAYQLRDFLQRADLPFTWVQVTTDDEARELAHVESLNDRRLPTCKLSSGIVLFAPSVQELAAALKWQRPPQRGEYDVAIYGAGPAGLSAAVCAASEGLRTILIEKSAVGGQAGSTSLIENYLGFPDGIPGWELAGRARCQALRLGAEIIVGAEPIAGRKKDDITHVSLSNGTHVASLTIICAVGVEYQRLWLANEDRLLNRGLYYGAGSSEAERCRGRVFVIGGGNSAGQAALHLARFAPQVTMLVRGKQLKNTLSAYLVERIENSANIEVLTRSTATAVEGEFRVEAIRYKTGTGQELGAETQHVFACVGGAPRTAIAEKSTMLTDNAGYLLTGPDVLEDERSKDLWKLERDPLRLETSMPGVFAIGDCRHNSTKRFATAVGEGGAVIPLVFRYLEQQRGNARRQSKSEQRPKQWLGDVDKNGLHT